MRTPLPMLLLLAVLAAACGKDELDTSVLRNNPFDPDYNGPPVFVADSTYLVTVMLGTIPTPFQVVAFHVREELFTAPAAYSVRVIDRSNGLASVIEPNPANSNRFTFLKGDYQVNVPLCLGLSLYNNLSAARTEEICVTLTP